MRGWDAVLDEVTATSPWRWAHEDGYFGFAGGDLDGAVALFVGEEGGPPGFLLFPTFDALAAFAAGPEDSWAEVDHLGLHLLAREGGIAPRLVAVEGGHARVPDARENARTLRALGGAVALCRRHGAAVAGGTPAALRFDGADGEGVSVVWAVEDPDLFPDAEHRLEVSADGPRLVLVVDAADEGRARDVLAWIAVVQVVRKPDGLVLEAALAGHGSGALSVFGADDAAAIALLLDRAGRIEVWLGAGDRAPERVAGFPCRAS